MPQQRCHKCLLLRSFSDRVLLNEAGKIKFAQTFNGQISERLFSLFLPIVDLSLS